MSLNKPLSIQTHEFKSAKWDEITASAYGLVPDPWQQKILDVWLGRDKDDKLTATTCGLVVPRQNG